jgi:hypothetical protein
LKIKSDLNAKLVGDGIIMTYNEPEPKERDNNNDDDPKTSEEYRNKIRIISDDVEQALNMIRLHAGYSDDLMLVEDYLAEIQEGLVKIDRLTLVEMLRKDQSTIDKFLY